jgi:uncharacterized lipoprotein YddW (UPF0748 family)/predicted transcriptional regulator
MALENEINQRKFRTEYQKARINIIYTYNWLTERINTIFDEWDITPRQFNILRILRGAGKPLSTLQIRQRMLDKMSDTSRIVDRLLKKGLVKKTPNSEDRRLVDIVITAKGKKLLEKIDVYEGDADKIMTNLSEAETKTLNNLLDKLRNVAMAVLLVTGLLVPAVSPAQSVAPMAATSSAVAPAAKLSEPVAFPKYEFRAVWVASVENIDWPSKKGLPVDSQKVEFIRLLDMHKRNGMNAVVVQIRPAADAFFPSSYEPWSEYLTGVQGQAPVPYYDPLQFMIEETHKRGMEFHAWCNPYRAVFSVFKSSVASNHITRQHPEWFVRFQNTLYFDPGNKNVQQYVTMVIRDIVQRYDIDAIHMDDYFYPYDIMEGGPPGKDFPDRASFERYGNGLSIADWRRSNVDSVILSISKAIKEEKKYCKFGISPYCVWRNRSRDPEGSETQSISNYDNLYADILLWLKNGWIDYVSPQLYYESTHPHVPFDVLLDWWSRHSYGRQCYIGLGIFRAGTNPAWRDRTQLPRQLQELREYPDVQGEIYFSSKSFEKNPNGWDDSLQNNYYKYPALIPPMSWIDTTRPHEPVFHREYNGKDLSATAWLSKGAADDSLRGFAVYRTDSADLSIDSLPVFQFIPYDPVAGFTVRTPVEEKGKVHYYFVTAVSRTNVESRPVPVPIAAGW